MYYQEEWAGALLIRLASEHGETAEQQAARLDYKLGTIRANRAYFFFSRPFAAKVVAAYELCGEDKRIAERRG